MRYQTVVVLASATLFLLGGCGSSSTSPESPPDPSLGAQVTVTNRANSVTVPKNPYFAPTKYVFCCAKVDGLVAKRAEKCLLRPPKVGTCSPKNAKFGPEKYQHRSPKVPSSSHQWWVLPTSNPNANPS